MQALGAGREIRERVQKEILELSEQLKKMTLYFWGVFGLAVIAVLVCLFLAIRSSG